MFIKREALNKSGLLDEQFFMYGEDIDLSYRITQTGYKNYYYPECQIIHYKGESTKKGSLNYVLVFYKAMIIFAKKHFKSNKASTFIILINLAIYFRALLSIIKRIINTLWLPLLDALLIAVGLLIITPLWESFRFQSSNIYPTEYVALLGSFYILAWILTLWINGAYDKPQKLIDSPKGVLSGSILILVVYSILPNEVRFSRAIIILTGLWALISTLGIRILLSKFNPRVIINNKFIKKIAIIGSGSEEQRVKEILNNSGIKYTYVGNYELMVDEDKNSLSFERLGEFVRVNSVDELIFCTKDLSMQSIVTAMLFLSTLGKEYKIAPHEGTFIIGSNSIESTGELYTLDIKAIGTQASKRNKRLFDLSISSLIVLLIPLLLIIIKNPFKNWINALKVLVGSKTWISYNAEYKTDNLPKIKEGIFPFKLSSAKTDETSLNLFYARNYNVGLDLKILLNNILR